MTRCHAHDVAMSANRGMLNAQPCHAERQRCRLCAGGRSASGLQLARKLSSA